MSPKNILITILGPSAIGKTALSIKLSKHFNCDIISCDSRQFYKEMSIGTAVPKPKELAVSKHHFIQNKSVFDDYNVWDFQIDSLSKLKELFQKKSIQIMIGGSGLYVDAVLKGLDYFPKIDPKVRASIEENLKTNGVEALQNQLKELDIDSYNNIDLNNSRRLIRALEVCIGTKTPYSTFKNKPKIHRDFHSIKIGLNSKRETLYEIINQRVDIMIKNGLIDEAKKLYKHRNLKALQTVGYKELFFCFDGIFTKEFAISEIKKNTRRFAKRQLTWFKKDKSINWYDHKESPSNIIKDISYKINLLKLQGVSRYVDG